VEIKDEAWDWVKIKVNHNIVAWTTYAGANPYSLWKPPVGDDTVAEGVQLPKLLYLPHVVAKYAMEGDGPRTAFQMYQFVGALAQKEDSGVTQADSKEIMYWFLAAGQIEPGKTGQSSSVKTELGHVLQTSQAFHQWANQKMKGYLGDGPHSVVQQGPAAGGLADYSVQQLTNTVATFGANLAADREAKSKKETEGKALTETNLAYLMGWCGVSTPGEVPAFWPSVRATSDIAAHRELFPPG
jgi:hypothetical protein